MDYESCLASVSDLARSFFGKDITIVENESVMAEFVASSNAASIFLTKEDNNDNDNNNNKKNTRVIIHRDTTTLKTDSPRASHLVVISKSSSQLQKGVSLMAQVNIITLPLHTGGGESSGSGGHNAPSYERLRSTLGNGLLPYYDIISEGRSASSMTRKKFAELTASLQHSISHIQAPDLLSSAHAKIKRAVVQGESITELLADSDFLNELTTITNEWVRQIQAVTQADHRPGDGNSMIEEVRFWSQMENALISLQKQIQSPEIKLTMEILSRARRFHVTISFENDTGISEMTKKAASLNSFLRELPINELLAINDDPQLQNFQQVVTQLFSHLKQKLTFLTPERAKEAIELLLKEIIDKFRVLASATSVMSIPLHVLSRTVHEYQKILSNIEDNLKFLSNILRELARKSKDKHKLVSLKQRNLDHLRNLLDNLLTFRNRHEALLSYLKITFSKDESSSNASKLTEAYNKHILSLNPVNPAREAEILWTVNERTYMETFNVVYGSWATKMNLFLEQATSFIDYLKVFRQFKVASEGLGENKNKDKDKDRDKGESESNGVLSGNLPIPINDSQKLSILGSALREIQALKVTASESDGDTLTQVVNSKSLASRVGYYRTNLEFMIGPDWMKYSVGPRIEALSKSILASRNPDELFQVMMDKDLQAANKIFQETETVVEIRDVLGNYQIVLNSDLKSLQSWHKLNLIKHSGPATMPHSVLVESHKICRILPLAVEISDQLYAIKSIFESAFSEGPKSEYCRLFSTKLIHQLTGLVGNLTLVKWAHLSRAVNFLKSHDDSLIHSDALVEMKSLRCVKEIRAILDSIYFQNSKVTNILHFLEQRIHDLKTAKFDKEVFASVLNQTQERLLDLFDEGEWTEMIIKIANNEIVQALSTRLKGQLSVYLGLTLRDHDQQLDMKEIEGYIQEFSISQHQLTFEDEALICSPSLTEGQYSAFAFVKSLIEVVLEQKLLGADSANSHVHAPEATSFEKMVVCVPDTQATINSVFIHITNLFREGEEYLAKWRVLVNLCSLNFDDAAELDSLLDPSKDIFRWFETVRDIYDYGSLVDDSESKQFNGLFAINSSRISSKMSISFDKFSKNLLSHFAHRLKVLVRSVEQELATSRQSLLSAFKLDVDAPKLIADVGEIITSRLNFDHWGKLVDGFKEIQLFLRKKRFNFHTDWLFTEQLENHLCSISALLETKELLFKENLEFLATKTKGEIDKTMQSIQALGKDWEANKPISGTLTPAYAISQLNEYQSRNDNLRSYLATMKSISVYFGFDAFKEHSEPVSLSDQVDALKKVWSQIHVLWEEVEALKLIPLANLDSHALRQRLDSLSAFARDLPANVRQYSAVEEIKIQVKTFLKAQPKLVELNSAVMKPRHWEKLLNQLGSSLKPSNLTVGDIWSLNLASNFQSQIVEDILEQARDERAIEESVQKIRESWEHAALELFNYENKCRLVKNWDAILDHCEQDLNSLTLMKKSPHHAPFEKEIWDLDTKIAALFSICNVWIDVQREWIELDGIFGNNDKSDVKTILPAEHARFQNLTFEFLALVKRVYKFDQVIDIILISDSHRVMSKFLDTLTKIQKSLAEYLESQRNIYPRFFFLGNDDLLELIGTSNDMSRINKHLKKMFGGVESVIYNQKENAIVAVASGDEKLSLVTPVQLDKFTYLHEWLSELEDQVRLSLAQLLGEYIGSWETILKDEQADVAPLVNKLPGQILILLMQVSFTNLVEEAEKKEKYAEDMPLMNSTKSDPSRLGDVLETMLKRIIRLSRTSPGFLTQRKLRNLSIEILHQQKILTVVQSAPTVLERVSRWTMYQRFYFKTNHPSSDGRPRLVVKQAFTEFEYGFEYIGNPEKLAYTPLIDECFVAMTQALSMNQGGSSFGPAGTGKTESVKALGQNLGKMVIVFCCDERFDFQSISRILSGLCRVGAWACFDEFNRLEEHNLSAVSSLITSIQVNLRNRDQTVSLSGLESALHPETALFVTMNPGYSGRSQLPENLKKLFRGFSMFKPDSQIIAQVLLTSETFESASELSEVIVQVFNELQAKASKQKHYDFGLRAIKSAVNRCGQILQAQIANGKHSEKSMSEMGIAVRCLDDLIVPRLTMEDRVIYDEVKKKYCISHSWDSDEGEDKLILELRRYCEKHELVAEEEFIKKALQLSKIQIAHHGIIMVGESGCGKSTILKMVLEALSKVEEIEHYSININPKGLSKNHLYGRFDKVTKQWTDGLFTSILRRIEENSRGEMHKRIWIVFDGDIDPVWVENLNSVLDDNRILTLPNGERLHLPANVRLVFETTSLDSATLATISRCGMVWFDNSVVAPSSLSTKLLCDVITHINETGEVTAKERLSLSPNVSSNVSSTLTSRALFSSELKRVLTHSLMTGLDSLAREHAHIMRYSFQRSVDSFGALLKTHLKQMVTSFNIDSNEVDITSIVLKIVFSCAVWGFAGDCTAKDRMNFELSLRKHPPFDSLDFPNESVLDFEISAAPPTGEWISLNTELGAQMDLQPHQVGDPKIIIPTTDTVKHEKLMHSMLAAHKPLLLCGPPGSGKTMTLMRALAKAPNLDLLSLNFSKETLPESLIASLESFCEHRRVNGKISLCPKVDGKWVVVFCDEINLPKTDEFGTQTVIALIRQMMEHNGFWRTKDLQWISLQNIQFVGACNPPTDTGRYELSETFMRRVCLIMVDYPARESLQRIYQTINSAVLKLSPRLSGFARELTAASIEVYQRSKDLFKASSQAHYVYSPRELTRWSRGLLEGTKQVAYSDLPGFLRLWYHEGLRLFSDRLSSEDERASAMEIMQAVARQFFPNVDLSVCFKSPVLFSDWLTLNYQSVSKRELQPFVRERLRVYNEEETEVQLVLHEDSLDHLLRIDRVLKQPQGHMILVGPSSSGKSTLAKFAAWINGLKVESLAVRTGFTLNDFDDILRKLLLRCLNGERICFLIDESSVVEASFIERMNILLANAEVPGLFEGDNHALLMNKCLETSQMQGLLFDSDTELYNWFVEQLSRNLHVIFTMSNSQQHSMTQKVLSSPALFNRCVLSWMGDWSNSCLHSIAFSEVSALPMLVSEVTTLSPSVDQKNKYTSSLTEAVIDTLIKFHKNVQNTQVFPAQFLNLVQIFTGFCRHKQSKLEERQRHLVLGFDKLRETVAQVDKMRQELKIKGDLLNAKNKEARSTLDKMLVDQNEAERKQEFSIEMQAELAKQEVEVESRREKVLRDLRSAEPAVLEAQRGVQNIKKQHLTEIRSMSNPPNAVKVTMESVCILLGYNVSSWRDVQLAVRSDDFIANIVNYNCETELTPELREYMEEVYLSRSDFTYEAVHRASKACGPLLEWVRAQVSYAKILTKVGPLRYEVEKLEQRSIKTRAQLIAIDEMIKELEEQIEKSKYEYSELIRQTENLKTELASVEQKINRSTLLIQNLASEKSRWKESISAFEEKSVQLVGDALLVAAFVTYAGPFDEKSRLDLRMLWQECLIRAGIAFDKNIAFSEYLLDSVKMKNYLSMGLADNFLNKSNIALLETGTFPLVIDPSGEIFQVVLKSRSEQMVAVTSFSSDGFLSALENALRFGGTLLVDDCENYNPILDQILRGDVRRTGGRLTVKLGGNWTDYNPKFRLIMFTKQTRIILPNLVMSRVSIINFSVSTGSLENMALDLALREFNPRLERRCAEINRANGELRIRLEKLEEELLLSLAQTADNILENDNVLQSLEVIKAESSEINKQLQAADEIVDEIDSAKTSFRSAARQVSRVFSQVQHLVLLSRFYSLPYGNFSSVFAKIIKGQKQDETIALRFCKELFETYAASLKYPDKVSLALFIVLALRFEVDGGASSKWEIDQLLRICSQPSNIAEPETPIQKESQDASLLDALYKELSKAEPDVLGFIDELTRPVRLIRSTFDSEYSLQWWLASKETQIIMGTTSDDFDATYKFTDIAEVEKVETVVISMGSLESSNVANQELKEAEKSQKWVIIQNAQMSPSWLAQLDTMIGNLKLHAGSKLILTCSSESVIPEKLISRSKVLRIENDKSFKNSFAELFSSISEVETRGGGNSFIALHVFLLLTWFHRHLMEISVYVPLTFEQHHDLNESDFKSAVHIVSKVLDEINSVEQIPWSSIRVMISDIIYGGKFSSEKDKCCIKELADKLFNHNSLESGFSVIENKYTEASGEKLELPDGRDLKTFTSWINSLPDKIPLSWLGLKEELGRANRERIANYAASTVTKYLQI
ncbi:uncharacterized protein LODBEIA_P33180 [Lodderomyces beijingensis]|uniref:Dynein heavy chain, cytoplasmic n=1 Tax=Lodderomyces beijingensis TaxID=1775926 RepID=A0ABP0ZMF9_9ASCO